MTTNVFKAFLVLAVIGIALLMGNTLLTGAEDTEATGCTWIKACSTEGAKPACCEVKGCPKDCTKACCEKKKEAGTCPKMNDAKECPSKCPKTACTKTKGTKTCSADAPPCSEVK